MTKNEQIAKIEVQMIELGVVVNTRAKNAQTLSIYLDALTAHGLAYCLYKVDPKDLDKTLAEAKEKHPLLLVGGGDGTIRSAAQSCVHSKTILGVLPLGTLNHFLKSWVCLQIQKNYAWLLKKIKRKPLMWRK